MMVSSLSLCSFSVVSTPLFQFQLSSCFFFRETVKFMFGQALQYPVKSVKVLESPSLQGVSVNQVFCFTSDHILVVKAIWPVVLATKTKLSAVILSYG